MQLRAPGPRDRAVECYIRRDRRAGTYALHLGPQPGGKLLLLAARKSRWRPCSADYAISAAGPGGDAGPVLGRLRAEFFGTQFTVFDNDPDAGGGATSSLSSGKAASGGGGGGGDGGGVTMAVEFALREFSARAPEGPRRMTCTLHTVPSKPPPAPAQATATASAGDSSLAATAATAAIAATGAHTAASTKLSSTNGSRSRAAVADCFEFAGSDCGGAGAGGLEPMVLKSRTARWHPHLQCWSLNFQGRVTMPSIKNFQLVDGAIKESIQPPVFRRLLYYPFDFDFTSVPNPNSAVPGGGSSATGAAAAPSSPSPVLLQSGKIGKDTFTMDYRYPLSAFQAFAICLSSFDTMVICY
eukprot:SM000143S00765  [mRNA]  locus=s143:228853:244718:- [translate_table: standard]